MQLVLSSVVPTMQRYPRSAFVDSSDSILLAGSDGTIQWFARDSPKSFVASSEAVSVNEGSIYTVEPIPISHDLFGETDGLVTGGSDKKIRFILRDGAEQLRLEGCEGVIESVVFHQSGVMYSGSWDGCIRGWTGDSMVSVDRSNQYSTQLVQFEDKIVSASGSKALSLFIPNKNGALELITRQELAHNSIIRRVLVTEIGIITCGNDGYIKVWSVSNGEFKCLLSICAWVSSGDQAEFIYDVKYKQGKVYAAGDDKHLKVFTVAEKNEHGVFQVLPSDTYKGYSPNHVVCEFLFASPARQQFFLPNDDVLCVGAFGAVVVTAKGSGREADVDTAVLYQSRVQEAQSKGKESIDVSTQPTVEVLLQPGAKNGVTKVVNIDGKGMVVSWNEGYSIWEVVGEALNRAEKPKQTEYLGTMFDHVVDVDVGTGVPLKLPFNRVDDPLEIASKFIEQENLPKDSLMQIVNFIEPYIDRTAMEQRKLALKESAIFLQPQTTSNWPYVKCNSLSSTQISSMKTKLAQLSESQGPFRLDSAELAAIHALLDRITEQSLVVNEVVERAFLKMFQWSVDALLPVMDQFRLAMLHGGAISVLLNPDPNDKLFMVSANTLFSCLQLAQKDCAESEKRRNTGIATMAVQAVTNFIANRLPAPIERDRELKQSPLPANIIFFLSAVCNSLASMNTTAYPRVAQEALKMYSNLASWLNRNPLNLTYNQHIYKDIFMTVLLLGSKVQNNVGTINSEVLSSSNIQVTMNLMANIFGRIPQLKHNIVQDQGNGQGHFQERLFSILEFSKEHAANNESMQAYIADIEQVMHKFK